MLEAPVRHTVSAILRPAYPPSAKMCSMNGNTPHQALHQQIMRKFRRARCQAYGREGNARFRRCHARQQTSEHSETQPCPRILGLRTGVPIAQMTLADDSIAIFSPQQVADREDRSHATIQIDSAVMGYLPNKPAICAPHKSRAAWRSARNRGAGRQPQLSHLPPRVTTALWPHQESRSCAAASALRESPYESAELGSGGLPQTARYTQVRRRSCNRHPLTPDS